MKMCPFNRSCHVLYQDVMKWWSILFSSWLPSTIATSKKHQVKMFCLNLLTTLTDSEAPALNVQTELWVATTFKCSLKLSLGHVLGLQLKSLNLQVSISRCVVTFNTSIFECINGVSCSQQMETFCTILILCSIHRRCMSILESC